MTSVNSAESRWISPARVTRTQMERALMKSATMPKSSPKQTLVIFGTDMKANPPNVRFWDYVNDGYVRITLKPGQELKHYRYSANEEGYSSTLEGWEYPVGETFIISKFAMHGRDCDGRVSRAGVSTCPIGNLDYRRPYQYQDGSGKLVWSPRQPAWVRKSSSCRDYEAEAAGY